ncbi:MAG TPA: UDP-N-acetylmuramoyl-L-alanyl-D-glutamate--2,6-diaminopimelate ligase [Bacteroidales bacterium]|nr:UDP-N-acetylmuramoyl-L-alanyl-D-glutamate--2,6-diaminopimelate ligase [Bacteroidales bacterium]HPS62323.1 UDP-N-acetylmuramoyl-L-alanyl-D-glutamate--2,6-diaminopimelate ligase [Bacteroidales bacterium]
MTTLQDILTPGIPYRITGPAGISVTGLQFDSRKAGPGDVFVAVKGTVSDGHDFILTAVEKGACAVVCEKMPETVAGGVTYVVTPDSSAELGRMASLFHGNPSKQLKLVGVTGTNGKTTTVTLLHRLFTGLGFATGLLSTIRNLVNEKEYPATHTTPDPLQLNELLAVMVREGCEYCFMEVSSHAVDQDRIAGLTFAGGIFTNLTHDHLDYHKTFEAYLAAKKRFFDQLPAGAFALVNKDDRNGRVMVQNTAATSHTLSLQSMADFRCRILENRFQGIHLNLDGHDAWFRLIGTFNAYNLLTVYATARLLGADPEEIVRLLTLMEPVDGRFNYVVSPDGVTAIVDYAHTPDALKNVLDTINQIRGHNEQLITVTGAGGNRDATKRPVMAKIAVTLSDRVILTSDNPRFEEPEAILAAMEAGVEIHQKKKVLVIENRLEAIKTACALSHPGDIILVAGKGHENYQEIRGVKHHFDDREVLREIFGNDKPENR